MSIERAVKRLYRVLRSSVETERYREYSTYVRAEETRRDRGNRYRESALREDTRLIRAREIRLPGYIIRANFSTRDSTAGYTEISEIEVRDAGRENGNWEQMLASLSDSVISSFNCSPDLYNNFHVHCHPKPWPGTLIVI